jgi:hypothetical protein
MFHATAAAAVSLALLAYAAAATAGEPAFRPLWDGKSLDAWHTIPGGEWKIEEGAIVGRNVASDPRHGHLVTDGQYGDFTIRLKFKAINGNSGLYFRIEKVPGDVGVKGFQGCRRALRNARAGVGRAAVGRRSEEVFQAG